jgi:hypothetical protein
MPAILIAGCAAADFAVVMSFGFTGILVLVLACGTVLAAHGITNYNSAAVDTFAGPATVNMFPGGSLEAAVTIRGRAAVNTMLFISVVLMKSVKAFGTTESEFCGTAMNTFGHEKLLVAIIGNSP